MPRYIITFKREPGYDEGETKEIEASFHIEEGSYTEFYKGSQRHPTLVAAYKTTDIKSFEEIPESAP